MKNVKLVHQSEHSECGLACATMIMNYWKIKISINELRDIYGVPRGGFNLLNLIQILRTHGLEAKAYKISTEDFLKSNLSEPVIALWKGNHYVVIEKILSNKVVICDPSEGKKRISLDDFALSFSGIFLDIVKVVVSNKTKIKKKKRDSIQYYIKQILSSKKIIICSILLTMIIIQLFSLVSPILIRYLIDNTILLEKIYRNFEIIGIILFLIIAFHLCLQLINGFLISKFKYYLNGGLIEKWIKKIGQITFADFINRASGDWVYRANIVNGIQQILSQQLLKSLIDVFMVLILFIVMFKFSKILTIITFFIAIFIIVLSFIYANIILRYGNREMVLQNQTQNAVIEYFEGLETIKSLNMEKYFLKNWFNKNLVERNLSLKKDYMSSIFNSLISCLIFYTPIILVYIGLMLSSNLSITLGTVIGYMSLSQSFLTPLNSLIGTFVQLTVLKNQFDKLNEILHIKTDKLVEGNKSLKDVQEIALQNVSLKYSMFDNKILKDISIKIKSGEKIAIVGKSGSGKSSFLKLINCLLKPTEGSVCINNLSIDNYSNKDLKDKIVMINQNPIIFNETLLYNITLGNLDYSIENLNEAIKDSTLDTLLNELPSKLDTKISNQGMNLSGGQKQKIILARAFLKKGKWLLLDEPTSALDPSSESKIIQHILQREDTCLFVSHKINIIQQFPKIILFDSGKIIDVGSHHELIERCELYREIFD